MEIKKIPTLYEWAGEIKTFEKLFTVFYDKVLKDDLAKHLADRFPLGTQLTVEVAA